MITQSKHEERKQQILEIMHVVYVKRFRFIGRTRSYIVLYSHKAAEPSIINGFTSS